MPEIVLLDILNPVDMNLQAVSLERQCSRAAMFAHLYGVACTNGTGSQNIAVLTIEKQGDEQTRKLTAPKARHGHDAIPGAQVWHESACMVG